MFADLGVSTDTLPTGTSQDSSKVETFLHSLVHGAHTVPAAQSLGADAAHSTSARLMAMNTSEVKRQVVTKKISY